MPAIRRLAAILAADMAGFSRVMGEDEGGTLKRIEAITAELTDLNIAEDRGRIVRSELPFRNPKHAELHLSGLRSVAREGRSLSGERFDHERK